MQGIVRSMLAVTIRWLAQKNEGANDNEGDNVRIVTASVLYTVLLLKEKRKQMTINAATAALSPKMCSTRCPVLKNAATEQESDRATARPSDRAIE